MILLSIETSCDETAVSVVKSLRGKKVRFEVLSHKVLSQIDLHREYGGVFPALAKREHARTITQLIAESLDEADLLVERTQTYYLPLQTKKKLESMLTREEEMKNALIVMFEGIQKPKIDAIAVTCGPGLEPALWVGINAALSLNLVWGVPVYSINHMEGHILTSLLTKEEEKYELQVPDSPSIALLISGGHTEIVRINNENKYSIIGSTKDDAIGEAFDKVARMLSLPYPGGPEISRLAKIARDNEVKIPEEFRLPRPMLHSKDLNFSFSGLKTSVMTKMKKYESISEEQRFILALEFENAVADVLVSKIKQAIYETNAKSLIVGGGVSANNHIRESLKSLAQEENIDLYLPDKKLSGDNALMIAVAGLFNIFNGVLPSETLKANGSYKLDQINN